MPARHFAKLNTLSAEASLKWPSIHPATRRTFCSEPERYLAAADQVLIDVQKRAPSVGKEIVRDPGPLGMRVIFRTCYIAARIGRQDDMSASELAWALRNPDSFEPLEPLLTNDSEVTGLTEQELGIIPYETPIDPAAQAHWKFQSGTLTVPKLDSMIAKRRERLGNLDAKGCPAHHAKIIRPLFESAITICERDENLFARSLD